MRTYADFFAFHDLAEDQERVIEAFRAGAGADYLGDAVSPRMADTLTLTGTFDQVAERIAAYADVADSIKLTPPVHGVGPADIRAAQARIIELIRELS